MSVYKKLQEARVALQGVQLDKSGNNKFAGYKYFELGDFLPEIQNIFHRIGLCGVVSFTAEIATLKVVDIDGGDFVEFTSPMGSANLKGCHEVQNIGAVETYQRRYLWVTAMEIVEHDALDATTGDEPQRTTKPQTKPQQATQSKPAQTKPAQPTQEGPGLSDGEMDDVTLAMREAEEVEALQKIFASAYRKATKQQQATLKTSYDRIKANFDLQT